MSQYAIYVKPNMERGAHIASNHDAQEEKVPINFDVVFHSCPCHGKFQFHTNNKTSIDKIDADIDKIVEHVDKSFKTVTESINANPLSLGN